ncbi:FAD binding domain-containing protein [Deltaproteobacteria bacterium OttesenSCG-928-M10]|nr:FAD binding domain-containing protein [Deltaproteobacteria bacterium OttesenSCG-928-M10]
MNRDHIKYHRPKTVAEAVETLGRSPETTGIMAGGTDLMIDLRDGKFKGDCLVDVTAIEGFGHLREEDGHISIGAGVKIEELRQSELVKTRLPALARAADKFAGLQVRNQATIGGNVGHAAPCGDTHPPLILYGGKAEVVSIKGSETVPVENLFAGPNRSALPPGHLITRFILKPETVHFADFQKIGRRKDLAISRVSLAIMLDLDAGGLISGCRVVLGACMPTTHRMPETEAFMNGQKPDRLLFKEAAAKMAAEMIAITGRRPSLAYKEPAIQGLFRRMLLPLTKEA